MLNFRFTGRASDLPQPVSKPAEVEDLGGIFERVLKGDLPGHPFRGNQYTDVAGSGEEGSASGGRVGGKEDPPPAPAPDPNVVREHMREKGVSESYSKAKSAENGVELDKDVIDKLEKEILAKVLDAEDAKPGTRERFEQFRAEIEKERGDPMPGYKNGFKGETRFKNSAIPGRDATEEGVGFTAERAKQNKEFVQDFVNAKEAAARPENDAKPMFTNLAGRGGSGKSKLEGIAYDSNKAIVVNADDIKMWRMAQDGHANKGHLAPLYHEESSQIAEQIMAEARQRGLNVVYDATMKSDKPEIPAAFVERGYNIHTVMVQVGREEAAERSVQRHVRGTHVPGEPVKARGPKEGEVGRLVPPSIVLGNFANEANFDREVARRNAPGDRFSLYDNMGGGQKTAPRLIANEKGEGPHGKDAIAAAARMRPAILKEDEKNPKLKKKKVDSSDDYGIIQEKGVAVMVSKVDKRTRDEAWADAQDYPDMPDDNVPESLVYEGFRSRKLDPDDVPEPTGGRWEGMRERYREWLKDHPFDS